MRKLNQFLLCFFLLSILSSCTKEIDWMDKGVITGMDMRMCACCGGYFIEINDSTYRFDNLPESSKIDLANETFPVYVYLNWKKKDSQCMGDEIIVTDIIKKNN